MADEQELQVAPTAEELMATVQAERQRAVALEQENARLNMERATRREPVQQQQPQDAYERFAQNIFADPKDTRESLKTAVRTDLSRAVNTVRNEFSQQLANDRIANDAQRALDRTVGRYPELQDPANQSRFAGMVTKAQVDAEAQGLKLSMDQIADRAGREYRMTYGPRQTTNAPYVEGSSNPGLSPAYAGQNPAEAQQKNMLEETYGMEVGTVEPIEPGAMKKITRAYIKDKNGYSRKRGTAASLIINAATEIS